MIKTRRVQKVSVRASSRSEGFFFLVTLVTIPYIAYFLSFLMSGNLHLKFSTRFHLVTGDETWVARYTPETERQSSQWRHPLPKNSKPSFWPKKLRHPFFPDHKGIAVTEFSPRGETVNAARYCESLKKIEKSNTEREERTDTEGSPFAARQCQTPYGQRNVATFGLEWFLFHPS